MCSKTVSAIASSHSLETPSAGASAARWGSNCPVQRRASVFCFMGNWRHITGMQFPDRAAPVLVISAPCVDFARCKPLRADVCSSFIVERCGLTGKRETVKIVSTNSLSRRGRRNVPSASESVFLCVAECGSFSKAAEKLFVSATAVMKADESAGSASGTAPAGANEPRCRFDAGGESVCQDARFLVAYSEEALARARAIEDRPRVFCGWARPF